VTASWPRSRRTCQPDVEGPRLTNRIRHEIFQADKCKTPPRHAWSGGVKQLGWCGLRIWSPGLRLRSSEPRTKTQLGLTAAIKNNVLVIVGRGCRLSVSKRRFHPVSFPGLDGAEARLVRFGQGEIIINKTVLIPIWDRRSRRELGMRRGGISDARGCFSPHRPD